MKILCSLSVPENTPSPGNAWWDPNCGSSNRPRVLGSSITGFSVWLRPSPALSGFVPEVRLPLAQPALWGPQEITSLRLFLDFPCSAGALSAFPRLIPFAAQRAPPAPLWSDPWHCLQGTVRFLVLFWFRERWIEWFLQREGEQMKEWMNRSMNKTFAEGQKCVCCLASWTAIIFRPCRGYSGSLFLGLDLNVTDVALALQAELQSANLLCLPCSTRIARENC